MHTTIAPAVVEHGGDQPDPVSSETDDRTTPPHRGHDATHQEAGA